MSVNLTVSKTVDGSQVADSLAGGDSGLDVGSVVNGKYCPIADQSSNTGWQVIYLHHDAVDNPVDSVKTYVAPFSGTYGGSASAALDYATLKAMGDADNKVTANNSDGLSSGYRIEHDADLPGTLGASAFLPSRDQVKIYGDADGGIDLASAYTIHPDCATYWDGASEVDASAPEAGKIGISTDSVLGNRASLKLRFYLEQLAVDGGILQWDWVVAYSFSA